MRKLLLVFVNIIILLQGLFVKELLCSPNNSMAILPVAVDGATITASDENSRNNVVSAAYNAHDHNDIDQTANTLNVGDAAAGDKTITAYNADTNKPYLKYDDTNNYWIVSTDGVAPSVVLQGTGAIFEGTTDDASETTISITDPTADRTQTIQNNSGVIPLGTAGNTLLLTTTGATNVTLPTTGTITAGLALPSGAVFFMLTGSCPAGTTDVTATYSDKFLRINATQGSTGGSDTVTLAEANLPSHTHGVGTLAAANEGAHTHAATFTDLSSGGSGVKPWLFTDTTNPQNKNIGPGSAHTHTLSGSTAAIGSGTAATITNPYVTCKMCQVN